MKNLKKISRENLKSINGGIDNRKNVVREIIAEAVFIGFLTINSVHRLLFQLVKEG